MYRLALLACCDCVPVGRRDVLACLPLIEKIAQLVVQSLESLDPWNEILLVEVLLLVDFLVQLFYATVVFGDSLVVFHSAAIEPHIGDACQTHFAEQTLFSNTVLVRHKILATRHDQVPLRKVGDVEMWVQRPARGLLAEEASR